MTITNKQIRSLREESEAEGDHRLADLCARALLGDDEADLVGEGGLEVPFADRSRAGAREDIAALLRRRAEIEGPW